MGVKREDLYYPGDAFKVDAAFRLYYSVLTNTDDDEKEKAFDFLDQGHGEIIPGKKSPSTNHMAIKKTKLSTTLRDLYGKDKYTVEVGKRYWYYWAGDNVISNKYGNGWYEIIVTYIRSGCMFYTFVSHPDIPEQFCPTKCFLTSGLIPSELDPIKDLPQISEDLEFAKLTVCFDDEHTAINNWDNRTEIEVTEVDLEKITPSQCAILEIVYRIG